jgi:hypothetical protein
VGALVVACGAARARPDWTRLPARPGKDDLDPLLAADPDRIVVAGTDADLAAVVLRLLRTERLALPVGFVPAGRSAAASLWGLPRRHADAVELALTGEPRAVPLVRDDASGVLVGRGTTGALEGEAYCDDQLALRGRASLIEVFPDPAGVRGIVHSGLLRRHTYQGRAFQIGCHPTSVAHDGVPHPREVKRWTWYRHTEDFHAVATTFGATH